MQDKATLLREKWAEALESGKYQQYRGSYFPWEQYDKHKYDGDSTYMCATAVLWKVSQSIGFNDEITGVALGIGINPGNVVQDNDNFELSFSEIAAKLRNGDYDVR